MNQPWCLKLVILRLEHQSLQEGGGVGERRGGEDSRVEGVGSGGGTRHRIPPIIPAFLRQKVLFSWRTAWCVV